MGEPEGTRAESTAARTSEQAGAASPADGGERARPRAVPDGASSADGVGDKASRERKRGWVSWLKRLVALAFVAAAAAAVVMAWLPKPVPVDLETLAVQRLEVTIDEDGKTRVKDRHVVSAPLMANVARIELEPGDSVEAGTVLARLVPLEAPLLDTRTRAQAQARVAATAAARKQAHAAIGRVRTALEFAEREAQRQRTLIESGASSARAVARASRAAIS